MIDVQAMIDVQFTPYFSSFSLKYLQLEQFCQGENANPKAILLGPKPDL